MYCPYEQKKIEQYHKYSLFADHIFEIFLHIYAIEYLW